MYFNNILLLAILFPFSAEAEGLPAARLSFVKGAVTVHAGGAKREGKTGDALVSGEAVATGAGAVAVVDISDGSQLKLRELSRVVLDLASDEAALSLGGIFAKVTKRSSNSSFRVRAGPAVVAVKGTEFFTAFGRPARGGRDLWVCVNEGAVVVATTASKKTVEVPQGRGVLIKSGRTLTRPQAYDWTKTLNWNMDPAGGSVEDKTELDGAYSDLLDQDYR